MSYTYTPAVLTGQYWPYQPVNISNLTKDLSPTLAAFVISSRLPAKPGEVPSPWVRVCVCVRARARACVRACARVCARVRV